MPLGTICDHLMAKVNCADAVQSFITADYPALLIVFANYCYLVNDMTG